MELPKIFGTQSAKAPEKPTDTDTVSAADTAKKGTIKKDPIITPVVIVDTPVAKLATPAPSTPLTDKVPTISKDAPKTALKDKKTEIKKEAPLTPVAKPLGKSILPGTILTKEDKAQMAGAKKTALAKEKTVKQAAFLFLLLSLGWFFWVQMNLSESNSVLSTFGVNENLGQEVSRLQKDKTKIRIEKKGIQKNTDKLKKQLEDKIYTRHSEQVQAIRDTQIQWFDITETDGSITFGLVDGVPRIQEYFNSRSYADPEAILSGKHSNIKVENLQVSREGVNFSVVASQILGKVFFLNIEFIEMVNSMPFFKNGEITQFARQKNEDDDDTMRFSVRLERQTLDEEDASDARFEEYTQWLTSLTQ